MFFASFISPVLLVTLAAISECRPAKGPYKDMLLRHIESHSFWDKSGTLNRAVSFDWRDRNSNTSTSCSTTWVDSLNSTSYPTSYIFCDTPGRNTTSKTEKWQWYFSSYVSPSNFTLQLAHEFKDPAQFPAPFDFLTFFSTTPVKLECSRRNGLEDCSLPRDEKVVHAVIDGISS